MRAIICVVLVSLLGFPGSTALHAQWNQTSGPAGRSVRSFAARGDTVYAGTWHGGVFSSGSNGDVWADMNGGLTDTTVQALLVNGTDLLAGTAVGGVCLWTNGGNSWGPFSGGLTNPSVQALALRDTHLFAGTYGGVFHHTSSVPGWDLAAGLADTTIFSLLARGSGLYAGTSTGVRRSVDNGGSLQPPGAGLPPTTVWALAGNDSFVFAGTSQGVYRSSDSGMTWTPAKTGLTTKSVRSLATSGALLFAGTFGGGVWVTGNNGILWTDISAGITNLYIHALAVHGTYIFAGTDGDGVWRRPLSQLVAVSREPSPMPEEPWLSQNYPNPFNPVTTIRFTIVDRHHTIVRVFDLLGREVSTLVNEVKDPGTHTVLFDGTGLATGVYYCRLISGGFVQTRKMLLVL